MTVTEQILARLRSEESYWGVTRPDVAPPAIPPQKPSYTVIGASSSSRITRLSDIEKRKYQPRTALGERLIAIREKAIAKGLPLLNADEIAEEILRRRGEID